MAKILIIDDDKSVPRALQAALAKAGHTVEIATEAEEGLRLAEKQDFDVVVADLRWRVGSSTRHEPKGLDLIAQLRSTKPQLPVILMTAYPATDTTIDATKRGAYDYVTKPGTHQEMEELVETVRAAAESPQPMPAADLTLCVAPLAASLPPVKPPERTETNAGQHEIRGRSRAIQTVLKQIGRAAARPVTVLICGETGTGKELVARALHEHSDRAGGPFVIVNCVAILESLLESELFGHEQGAFTGATAQRVGRFEQANHGTIFLDEIGDMSLSTQAKLLRVLQEKTIHRVGGKESFQVDVRVIAATHRDLERAVEEKKFRRDLYYRLNDAVIRLPALRDRKEDIPALAEFFLQQHTVELGATGSAIDADAMELLQQHPWPGNVRELRNVVRKALLSARGHRIDLALIRRVLGDTKLASRVPDQSDAASPVADQPLAAYVAELLDCAERGDCESVAAVLTEWAEREIYGQAIRLAEGDQSKAAKWLGVSRPTMREKLARYNLRPFKEGARKEEVL